MLKRLVAVKGCSGASWSTCSATNKANTCSVSSLPAFAVIGLLTPGLFPLLIVLIVCGVVRRAGEFALSKPAREILFTVVPREEKHKARNVIDTVVYRGGDAMSGRMVTALRRITEP